MSVLKSKEVLSYKIPSFVVTLIFTCLLFGAAGANSAFAQQVGSTEKIRDLAATPEKLSASFAEIAKRVEPAVVNIDTKGKIPDVALKGEKPSSEQSDDIMDFLRRHMPTRPSSAIGSGFIVDKSGYILTNNHVINDASRITIKLQSGEEYLAKVVGFDIETDIAVLKINAGRDLPFVALGDSDKAEVGDWVLAIGSPFGLAQSVTAGIVSQTKREAPFNVFQKFIQTDAAINRGNSGGPLLNMNGEVIGVNSQIATTSGDSNGIGFALPSNEAGNVYRQILQAGRVHRGYLGVNLDSVKSEFAKVYNLPEARGAIITTLSDKQSPAGKAGLQTGDIIVQFGSETVRDASDLIQKIASVAPEKEVNVTFYREVGNQIERKTTVIKLGERPSNNTVAADDDAPKKLPVGGQKTPLEPFGLTLTELTPQLAALYKLQGAKGVVVKNINPASFIADVKTSNGADALNEGDLIQRINRVSVTDAKTFTETANRLKTGDAVVMQVLARSPLSGSLQMRIVQFTVQ